MPLVFMFQLISFSHFENLKSTFFTSLHFAPRGCTKEFQVLGVQKSCKELK